jgi:DNA-binding transcriptional regulator YdaS (Cro superfamily)
MGDVHGAHFCPDAIVDKSVQAGTGVAQLLPPRVEGVRTPRAADERTLRMCFSEQDAIAASVTLSGLTYREIAARMGVSKSLINAMVKGERPLSGRRTQAFCNATGTALIHQYRDMERALREAAGRQRERDRIAAIVAPTERAWRAVA